MSCCRSPSLTNSAIVGDTLSRAGSPNSPRCLAGSPRGSGAIRERSSLPKRPRAKRWCSAGATPATYVPETSAARSEDRLPPARPKPSMECASTPKPRYGWRVQYFRLWRDSDPRRAKLEISYCPNAGRIQLFARCQIEIRGGLFVRHEVSAITGSARDHLAAQARVLVHFQHVDADVETPGPEGLRSAIAAMILRSGAAAQRSDRC